MQNDAQIDIVDANAQKFAPKTRSRFNWARAPAALVITALISRRVDYRRLHRYRLARVRQALGRSDSAHCSSSTSNNIRYVTSTKIGEWERDKLLTLGAAHADRRADSVDFGSAAVHHKLYTPVACAGELRRADRLRGTVRSILR